MASPDELPPFKHDDYIGWSGFTGVGYPKTVPTAIANYIDKNNLQDDPATTKKFNLFDCPSLPSSSRQGIRERNQYWYTGRIEFADKHLSIFPQDLTYGYYNLHKKHGDPKRPLNWAIVEVTAIMEEGHIVPGASVGATPEILQNAEKIIIEVNTAIPNLTGLHDINQSFVPPHRLPYTASATLPSPSTHTASSPSSNPNSRTTRAKNAPETDESQLIAKHLIEFLSSECDAGRLPRNLLPLQSGIGNVANSIIGGLAEGPFENIMVWTEVLQDTFIRFFDSEKLRFATATSIRFSPEGFDHFYKNTPPPLLINTHLLTLPLISSLNAYWENYQNRLLLRSQQVSNSPEIICRLGMIAMNTPLEVDIADFLRNAKLSIMHTPSVRPTKTDPTGISYIVPFATHVDQTEHDLDIIVTEQGLADVRGLSPRERAPVIIQNCAHPDYRDLLMDYYERALHECLKRGAGHEPHMLRLSFKKAIMVMAKQHTYLLLRGARSLASHSVIRRKASELDVAYPYINIGTLTIVHNVVD
ncbi:hypothetical protein BJ165DRAFT_1529382 [Panaeolus papilionaceus]|nr:hypothetical protein BJ165DRAFT_1529382 [Panaeolus papilionaceus]